MIRLDNSNNHNGIEFQDLNQDVLISILQHLDFEDLQPISTINEHFASLVMHVFKTKYQHTRFEIQMVGAHWYGDEDTFFLRDEGKAHSLLKHFGQLINKLEVNYLKPSGYYEKVPEDIQTKLQAMSKSIDSYCTETLREIDIHDERNSFFGQITKPFKSVEHVGLYGHFKNVNSGSLKFNEIFPEIKSLTISSTFEHIDQIAQKYPKLIELRLNLFDELNRKYINVGGIEQIMRQNPQIQRLEVEGLTESVLKTASETFLNLQFLRISLSHSDQFCSKPNIAFENVEILEIVGSPYPSSVEIDFINQILKRTKFGNLKDLRVQIPCNRGFHEWIHIIKKNINLEKFNFLEGCLSRKDLDKFTNARNVKLSDISITLCHDVEPEHIFKFVNENQNVEKFHFTVKLDNFNSNEPFEKFATRFAKILPKCFSDKWIITINARSIILENPMTYGR